MFGVEIPVLAHPAAEPDKGAGIAMCCTFGDLTDVQWWRELQLPTRAVIGRDGRLSAVTPDWITADVGRAAYNELAGRTVKQAQQRTVELLGESGELLGEPRSITHPVKFYERGARPLEIVTSRQWYIRNGGRDETLRSRFLERGRELGHELQLLLSEPFEQRHLGELLFDTVVTIHLVPSSARAREVCRIRRRRASLAGACSLQSRWPGRKPAIMTVTRSRP